MWYFFSLIFSTTSSNIILLVEPEFTTTLQNFTRILHLFLNRAILCFIRSKLFDQHSSKHKTLSFFRLYVIHLILLATRVIFFYIYHSLFMIWRWGLFKAPICKMAKLTTTVTLHTRNLWVTYVSSSTSIRTSLVASSSTISSYRSAFSGLLYQLFSTLIPMFIFPTMVTSSLSSLISSLAPILEIGIPFLLILFLHL